MIPVARGWIIPIVIEDKRYLPPSSRIVPGEERKKGSGAGAGKGEPEVVGLPPDGQRRDGGAAEAEREGSWTGADARALGAWRLGGWWAELTCLFFGPQFDGDD